MVQGEKAYQELHLNNCCTIWSVGGALLGYKAE